MQKVLSVCLKSLPVTALFCLVAQADPINVGYISYDVISPGASAEFDITNLTGPNSSGDPNFPITTSLNLSSLSLTIDFSNGTSVTEPSSYFTLASDGLSWNGTPIGIGGASPQPTEAILTGVFSPTTITLFNGTVETIGSTFSATILPSSPPDLHDGDFAIIQATTGTSTVVPEPGSWVLLATIVVLLGISRRQPVREILRKLPGVIRAGALPLALMAACSLLIPAAHAATVKLSGATAPSSGTVSTNVNVSVSTGWPAGDTTPGNITVTWATSCGAAASATDSANSLKVLLPGSERVNVTIPASLTTGTYFVQVSDTTGGDTPITSSNCSEVQVTGTSTAIACVPASSLGVVAPFTGPAAVYSYVPNSAWNGDGTTGIEIVQVETGGGPAVAPVNIATTDDINSCAGNPVTGEAVCTSNDTNVYHISAVPANTITKLTSGANSFSSFSGGDCENCGVAINATTNQAVLEIGLNTAPSGSAFQVLNLATNTFQAPFPLAHESSENIVVDVPDSAVLSANEANNFDVVSYNASGTLTTEFAMTLPASGESDSTAVDCTTRITIAPVEFSSPNQIILTDLSQATYTPGSPGTVTAPTTAFDFLSTTNDAAGPCGSAVAPGTQHLAIVTGEFGGSEFQVVKMQAAGGTGGAKPTVPDWADVTCVTGFSAGFDPHTVTAYVSPNNSKSYGLEANWTTGVPASLLQIDLAGVLALPRAADGHTVLGEGGAFTCLSPTGTVGSTVLTNIPF